MSKQLSNIVRVPRMERISEQPCLCLIGIAGAGKSTLGTLLAQGLGWPHADTDRLLEAYYAQPLQSLYDGAGQETFMQMEEHLACTLQLSRTVISTGGSVVYSQKAVAHLKTLGPVIHLRISPETFAARVGDAAGRGLCIGDKTREQLFDERRPLYEAAADFTVETDRHTPKQCRDMIFAWLREQGIPKAEKA